MEIQGWIVIADLWEEEHGHSCKPLLKETHREARENLNVISISGQQMKIRMDNLQKWFLLSPSIHMLDDQSILYVPVYWHERAQTICTNYNQEKE